jgi:hypothetical protein
MSAIFKFFASVLGKVLTAIAVVGAVFAAVYNYGNFSSSKKNASVAVISENQLDFQQDHKKGHYINEKKSEIRLLPLEKKARKKVISNELTLKGCRKVSFVLKTNNDVNYFPEDFNACTSLKCKIILDIHLSAEVQKINFEKINLSEVKEIYISGADKSGFALSSLEEETGSFLKQLVEFLQENSPLVSFKLSNLDLDIKDVREMLVGLSTLGELSLLSLEKVKVVQDEDFNFEPVCGFKALEYLKVSSDPDDGHLNQEDATFFFSEEVRSRLGEKQIERTKKAAMEDEKRSPFTENNSGEDLVPTHPHQNFDMADKKVPTEVPTEVRKRSRSEVPKRSRSEVPKRSRSEVPKRSRSVGPSSSNGSSQFRDCLNDFPEITPAPGQQ